ncbi:hypothetical protein [Burkholderia multivorans]|uniref:hypothetical protein n=1 Tax=Burkholderia multivorans TaxID=87883 RepID=UPI0015902D67|nr:hypothetical protein [Burkholderia multivorans]MBU9505507.1 hypothetical protein [Burkholderia multivorans]MCA8458254.1 hypothetical protein [Burkholderia multivorans]MDN8051780.1 hypothetical protein [Burkholderia multivorans]
MVASFGRASARVACRCARRLFRNRRRARGASQCREGRGRCCDAAYGARAARRPAEAARRPPVARLRRCGNYFHRVAWRMRDRRSLWAQHPLALLLSLSLMLTPSAERRAPSAERRAPSAERRTPNAERRTPNAERRTPNAERRTPNAERRTPTIRTPADREPARAARPT